MSTVLGRTTGRASLILVATGVVGSAALPAVPAVAVVVHHPAGRPHSGVQLGTAVKYVREPDGSVRQVRGEQRVGVG